MAIVTPASIGNEPPPGAADAGRAPRVSRGLAGLTVVSGLASVVLYVAGALMVFDLPGANATPERVAAYVHDRHALLLIASYVWGLAITANLAVVVAMYEVLRGSPPARVASGMGMAAGVALCTLEFVAFAVFATLVHGEARDPAAARTIADLFAVTLSYGGFASALWSAAVSFALLRAGWLRGWIAWLGFLGAAIHVVAAASLERSGPFSPAGIAGYAGPAAVIAWIGAVAVAIAAVGGMPMPRGVRWLVQGVR